jgi:hypothetical protein
MENYLAYKVWWLSHEINFCLESELSFEAQFEEHINMELTTYEFMEILANWKEDK